MTIRKCATCCEAATDHDRLCKWCRLQANLPDDDDDEWDDEFYLELQSAGIVE